MELTNDPFSVIIAYVRWIVVPTGRPDDRPGWSTRRAQLAGAEPWVGGERRLENAEGVARNVARIDPSIATIADPRRSSGHPCGVCGTCDRRAHPGFRE